jgi:hypothetical protein
VMTGAWAEDSTNRLHDWSTDAATDQIFMISSVNRSKYISEAYGWGSGNIYFFWEDYN